MAISCEEFSINDEFLFYELLSRLKEASQMLLNAASKWDLDGINGQTVLLNPS